MHVLVTGGTGFIGRSLCGVLREGGHAVTVLSRRKKGRRRLPGGVRRVDSLEGLSGVDAIVNLAGENLGEGRWTEARKQAFRDSRLETTARLLAWIATQEPRPQVLVSASAIGYYGSRGDEVLEESASAGSDFSARLCRDWEAEAIKAEALSLRVCRLRIGVVLGQGGGALGKMLPPFRVGLGGPMGDGRQWMSWIRRTDLVRLIIWLLRTESARGAYNGTAPAPVQNREFANRLGAALRRPALLTTPAFALRLAFGEMAELLLGSQRVLPTRALAEGFRFHYPELGPALKQLLNPPASPAKGESRSR